MAQVTAYVCDVCGSFYPTRDGWLKVSSYSDASTDKPVEVCSNECIIEWGRKRKAEGVGLSRQSGSGSKRGLVRYGDDFKLEVVTYAKAHGDEHAAKHFNTDVRNVTRWREQIDP